MPLIIFSEQRLYKLSAEENKYIFVAIALDEDAYFMDLQNASI